MKKPLLSTCLLAALTSLPVVAEQAPTAQLQQEGKAAIQALATTLKTELETAMKQSGPTAAIEVCNTKAQPLTQKVAKQQGWQIGRTSLKLRNPDNAPDGWEKAVLQKFQQQAEQGANLKQLAYSEIVTDASGQRVFRMMKAIPVGEKCLHCHGTQIKPEVTQLLDRLYPEDRARGFDKGDLRGAFTLQKVL